MQGQEPLDVALEITKQVEQLPEQYRIDAFKVLLEHRLRTGVAITAPVRGYTVPVAGEISFGEFLNQLEELKTNPQRFTAVAYYYAHHRQEDTVTQDDIVNSMVGAGVQPPKNFSRDMQVATSAKNALLMRAREPKNGVPAWQLTRTGQKFIEQKLKGV